nr:hypothetical protein [Tanacetum cinerariifolium]
MAPVTRQGQNSPPPNTDTPPHHMTPKLVQAMIDQALLRNSTNGDGSQNQDLRSRGLCNDLGSTQEEMDKYCPQGEVKKLETELWNLKTSFKHSSHTHWSTCIVMSSITLDGY